MTGIELQYSNNDLTLEPVVRNGTLLTGETLHQNQALILCLHKGELKERPAVGVGISDMLLDNDPIFWRSTIKEQLEMDGQRVTKVTLKEKEILIEANY